MNGCKNVNEASIVNSQHVVRYKSKITHCPVDSILSEYIATITLDDVKKSSIDEVLEVLIGVGSFTNMGCFDKQSLFVSFFYLLHDKKSRRWHITKV